MCAARVPKIAVAPRGARSYLADAVQAGGGELVGIEEANGLVWTSHEDPGALVEVLREHPEIAWIQLPWAGIEPYRDLLDPGRLWTCAKGVYADPVAEHALALLLAGLRGLVSYARASHWSSGQGTNLYDARITILGGGGITESLLPLLAPFRAEVTVLRRRPRPMDGAARVVGIDELHDVLPGAAGVVLALPALPDTIGIIGADELALMEPHAWLVNVARGVHVDTEALVAALQAGTIGGAALDVTDPEPLPDDHPLWRLPNVVITPHTANTQEMAEPLLSARVTENVRRFAAGEPLSGVVDPALGY
ncbi:MAG: hydroxyacid dehydrogenase [Acidimicrobiales bacterium]|nr:hydroxyacid dehydrogenase [Acidimicrobiales bacterium]